MKDPGLVKIRSVIKSDFYCYFKHNNILTISEDKASLPFIIIVKEADYRVSIAVDYLSPIVVAHLILAISKVKPINLAESFYISPNTGQTYFGHEASDQWDMDNLDISMVEPISRSLN